MEKQKWTTQYNYAENKQKGPSWEQLREDPKKYNLSDNAVKKQTVPGQAISVKELMDRYEKGRPIPQE